MSYVHPAWLEHQRRRFERHDAHRFTKPEPLRRKSYSERVLEQRRAEDERAAFEVEKEQVDRNLANVRWLVADLKLDLAIRRLTLKYRPDQPRDERGRWVDDEQTEDVGGELGAEQIVVSDEAADEPIAGEQYATSRPRGPGRGPVLINGRWIQPTPRQEAELQALEARAAAAMHKVREVLPSWRPTASAYSTIDGRIEATRREAEQAEARVRDLQDKGLLPGRYAGESIPARGPERRHNKEERSELDRIFGDTGCNTCGTRDAGTPSGRPIADHHIPSALASPGSSQRLYPQCLSCSLMQGGHVRAIMGRR